MKTPSALDFARLFGVLDYDVLPPKKVAKILRTLADLLERNKHDPSEPNLCLVEAHSMENIAAGENGFITLLLRFRRTTPWDSPEARRKADRLTKAQTRDLLRDLTWWKRKGEKEVSP